jgi:hypothetical protein
VVGDPGQARRRPALAPTHRVAGSITCHPTAHRLPILAA